MSRRRVEIVNEMTGHTLTDMVVLSRRGDEIYLKNGIVVRCLDRQESVLSALTGIESIPLTHSLETVRDGN
jgi:hypothetical protein